MPTTQLRTYRITDGRMAEFVEWWREEAVPVRALHGFRVDFAYVDRANNEFVWTLTHDCEPHEFDEIDARYKASPEHLELRSRSIGAVESHSTARVEIVTTPSAVAGINP